MKSADKAGVILGIAAMCFILVGQCSASAEPPRIYGGPYRGVVVDVKDGDSVKAEVYLWPHLATVISIRIRGIDVPEDSYRAKCSKERRLGAMATEYARGFAKEGSPIRVFDISPDKYGGRVVGRVEIEVVRGTKVEREDWRTIMMAGGYAKEYDGGQKPGWCD